jgi:hypothetical protein
VRAARTSEGLAVPTALWACVRLSARAGVLVAVIGGRCAVEEAQDECLRRTLPGTTAEDDKREQVVRREFGKGFRFRPPGAACSRLTRAARVRVYASGRRGGSPVVLCGRERAHRLHGEALVELDEQGF